MKAIIVTHPTRGHKACLFGLDYAKLCLLAELRSKNKKSIKSRFKTLEYKNEYDLVRKIGGQPISIYKISVNMYRKEINNYFDLKHYEHEDELDND